ncbi:MAG: hypothetical protein ACI9DC_001242 [Gammaproteobacteria bacterium]|jgi:hypothetical protein
MHNTENDADAPENGETQGDDPRADVADVAENQAAAGREESMIDETLHHALSDLEQILEQRQGAADAEDAEQRTGEALVDEDIDHYTIPLLNEVVRPGTEPQVSLPPVSATPPQVALDSQSHDELHDDSEPALRRRFAERLASEIEIITQDRIEAALEKAHEEIRAQVRNHLDIILPEVVEELNQARRRRDGDSDH